MSRDVEFDENDVMRRETDEARAANVTLYATNKNLPKPSTVARKSQDNSVYGGGPLKPIKVDANHA